MGVLAPTAKHAVPKDHKASDVGLSFQTDVFATQKWHLFWMALYGGGQAKTHLGYIIAADKGLSWRYEHSGTLVYAKPVQRHFPVYHILVLPIPTTIRDTYPKSFRSRRRRALTLPSAIDVTQIGKRSFLWIICASAHLTEKTARVAEKVFGRPNQFLPENTTKGKSRTCICGWCVNVWPKDVEIIIRCWHVSQLNRYHAALLTCCFISIVDKGYSDDSGYDDTN